MAADIREWLDANGFGRFADLFEENEIDDEALPELTDEHLKELGIALGPRVKLLKAIQQLRDTGSAIEASTPEAFLTFAARDIQVPQFSSCIKVSNLESGF